MKRENKVTLQRHGANSWKEKILDNGVYISTKSYQDNGVLIEIYKKDELNIRETFLTENLLNWLEWPE